MRARIVVTAVLALVGTAGAAHADARRLALLRAAPELERSVNLALYPWDIEVLAVDEAPPSTSDAEGARRADVIARRHAADAIAWVARTGDAVSLCLYDATTQTLTARPLRAGPAPSDAGGDAADVAAVALTLKTLLRASSLDRPAPAVAPATIVPADVTAPASNRADAARVRIDVDLAYRFGIDASGGEPRLGVWLGIGPSRDGVRVGFAVGASAGLGTTTEGEAARASLQDIDLRAALRLRVPLAPAFAFEPRLGASLHVERAEIALASSAVRDTRTRGNPSADASVAIAWDVAPAVSWLVGGEAIAFLRHQRWYAGDLVVASSPSLAVQIASSVAWRFE